MTWRKTNVTNPLFGKKINCIGDSICRGLTHDVNSWQKYLTDNYGCTTNNYGVNGCTMVDNASVASVYYRYPSMDTTADMVIIWAGWNDLHQGQPLGTFNDTVATSFYGVLKILLNDLQSRYLGKKIFICTIIDTLDGWTTLKNFNAAIREVAEYYNISVIDLAKNAGFSARNADVLTTYVPDNVHPNGLGNALIGEVIARHINTH